MDNSIENEIFRVEKESVNIVSIESIKEIFSILKNIDKDMAPLLEILFRVTKATDDSQLQTLTLIKLLKFYGIKNKDILASRQKFVIEDGNLIKKPYLKKSQKENILALLETLNIEVF